MFELAVFIYVGTLLYWGIRIAQSGTLYIFSPFLIIEIPFIAQCLLPCYIYIQNDKLETPFNYIIISSIIVHVILLFAHGKSLCIRKINSNVFEYKNNVNINPFLITCLLIVLLFGFITGITGGLLSGRNIEGLRREKEIGLGFLEIFIFTIQILLLIKVLNKKQGVRNFLLCFVVGVVLFLSKGHKALFATCFLIFCAFYNIRYRGFRIYEYLAFYYIQPIFAGILQTIRGGDLRLLYENIEIFISYYVLLLKVNIIPVVRVIYDTHKYLWGEEFLTSLLDFIPRSIWPEKPVAFDYYYKELLEYDFEGGGVPIPTEFSMFLNFSYMSPLLLLVWYLLIYRLYYYLFISKSYLLKVAIIILLIGVLRPSTFIHRFEILLLALIVIYFSIGRNLKKYSKT